MWLSARRYDAYASSELSHRVGQPASGSPGRILRAQFAHRINSIDVIELSVAPWLPQAKYEENARAFENREFVPKLPREREYYSLDSFAGASLQSSGSGRGPGRSRESRGFLSAACHDLEKRLTGKFDEQRRRSIGVRLIRDWPVRNTGSILPRAARHFRLTPSETKRLATPRLGR
jgi:hypothetical protein